MRLSSTDQNALQHSAVSFLSSDVLHFNYRNDIYSIQIPTVITAALPMSLTDLIYT